MDYYKSIPYLDRVINQPSIYNKLTCRDFDHLVTMLPAALFRYNYKEVDPDDFALPEYYTSADIEKAIDKVVIHLEQYIHSKLTNPDSYIRELKESLGSCYSEEMRDYWIDEIDYAPTSVMDAIIYEVCYDMLWFNENKITDGYKNISPSPPTRAWPSTAIGKRAPVWICSTPSMSGWVLRMSFFVK